MSLTREEITENALFGNCACIMLYRLEDLSYRAKLLLRPIPTRKMQKFKIAEIEKQTIRTKNDAYKGLAPCILQVTRIYDKQ